MPRSPALSSSAPCSLADAFHSSCDDPDSLSAHSSPEQRRAGIEVRRGLGRDALNPASRLDGSVDRRRQQLPGDAGMTRSDRAVDHSFDRQADDALGQALPLKR